MELDCFVVVWLIKGNWEKSSSASSSSNSSMDRHKEGKEAEFSTHFQLTFTGNALLLV